MRRYDKRRTNPGRPFKLGERLVAFSVKAPLSMAEALTARCNASGMTFAAAWREALGEWLSRTPAQPEASTLTASKPKDP